MVPKLKNLSGTLLFLLPGTVLILLSVLGSSIVYWQGHKIAEKFRNESLAQINAHRDEMTNLIMAGRYVELSVALENVKDSANLAAASIISIDGQLLSRVGPDSSGTEIGVTSIELAKHDIDGTLIPWGILRFSIDQAKMNDWTVNIRQRWTTLATVVVFVVLLFAIFAALMLKRQMRGLFTNLTDLEKRVKLAETPAELAASLSQNFDRISNLKEEASLFHAMAIVGLQISELHKKSMDLEVEARMGQTIAQVVHDIRSLISLLKVLSDAEGIPIEHAHLLKMAVERLTTITSDLLSKFRSENDNTLSSVDATLNVENNPGLIWVAVDQVIAEKRAIHSHRPAEISVKYSKEFLKSFANIDIKELSRALSNIIENAIEASVHGNSEVQIFGDIISESKMLSIKITDKGCGIPKEILGRLGTKGATFGKSKGNGLGVYHAKQFLESLGGRLEITSEIGVGTGINMIIPMAHSPNWFIHNLALPRKKIIVVDDDLSIHEFCRQQFGDMVLACYTDPAQIDLTMLKNPDLQFLIDYDIRGAAMNGLDFIERNQVSSRATLITQDFAKSAIQKRAESIGCNIIPKPILNLVKIIES